MLALNLESVKPVNYTTVNGERLPLFKSRYTSNLSPVHVSDYMSGKMEGIPSISTSCLENPICRARMENGESVCSHCFAAATLDRYTAAGENHFDHIFTVFDKKTADFYGDGFINCGARDCATCRRCYGKNPQEFNVKELLK